MQAGLLSMLQMLEPGMREMTVPMSKTPKKNGATTQDNGPVSMKGLKLELLMLTSSAA